MEKFENNGKDKTRWNENLAGNASPTQKITLWIWVSKIMQELTKINFIGDVDELWIGENARWL